MRYLLITFVLCACTAIGVAQPIAPEDQGEDFSLLDDAENFKRLTTADNKVERWKAAKVLGTRFLEGKYVPTEAEQKQIDEYVAFLFTQFQTGNGGDAGDASVQLQRLWSLAIPGLFEGLKSKDNRTWNVALEHLVHMRSESVMEHLINEYRNSDGIDYKIVILDAIGKMRTMYDDLDYRKMMSESQSKALADKLIVPFLADLLKTETDEQLLNWIHQAMKFIEMPIDSRIRPVVPGASEAVPDLSVADYKPPPPLVVDSVDPAVRRSSVVALIVVTFAVIALLGTGAFFVYRRYRL